MPGGERVTLRLEALESRLLPSLSAHLLADVNPQASGPAPGPFVDVGGVAYFSADDGIHGRQLWKTDGTAAGTMMVKDIGPGGPGSGPVYLTNVNGTLFFEVPDNANEAELWRSNGTAAGTVLVRAINQPYAGYPPSRFDDLTNINGTLFFANNPAGGLPELWASNGTTAGTVPIKQFPLSSDYPRFLTEFEGTLFFQANGTELWKSNGTAAGTIVVKDLNSGSVNSYPSYLTNVNGTMFFDASVGSHGQELWRSNGTAAGTQMVKGDFPGSPFSFLNDFTNVNGTLFFFSNPPQANGNAPPLSATPILWRSDGTAAGTISLGDFTSNYPPHRTHAPAAVNGTLFFAAERSTSKGSDGVELWESNGTVAGTSPVKDINPGPAGSFPSLLTNVGGRLFFAAISGANGDQLWESNGTAAGTVLVADINPQGSHPAYLANVGGTLFFSATPSARL